jgi:nucleoside-diphosphate-sugar epimerase
LARILVTGGSGFIGTPLVRELRKSHEVLALSRDAGDIAEPGTLEQVKPVEHVFHFAGRTFVPDSWKDTAGFMSTNVLGTANVIAYCRRVRAPLTFASAYVYGKPERLPIAEDARPKPNNPYALSKYLAEQLCEFAAAYDGLRVTVIRPFNIYGPGQPEHFLIPTIIRQLKAGGPIRVMDLAPRRDYLHVDDLVRLLTSTVAGKGKSYCLVNAGSGESRSVREIIDIVQEIAGTSLDVLDEGKPRHQELDDVRADVSLAAREFGWKPTTSLRVGIERLIRETASQ